MRIDTVLLYTPDARSAIDEVVAGRDAVYASVYHNVTGSVHAFRPRRERQLERDDARAAGRRLDPYRRAPMTGARRRISASRATRRRRRCTRSGDGAPAPIKVAAGALRCHGLATEQFVATSKDGTKIPYFVTRSRASRGPPPTVLYGYGGFEISLTPGYSANFGMLWLTKGGVYRGRQHPRRRRVRPGLAPGGAPREPPEGLRRFPGRRRRSREARHHHAEAARHHGRLERRAAGQRQHGRSGPSCSARSSARCR